MKSGAPGEIRTPDPLLRSYAIQNSKCRFWCRLRGSASFISPLNWTEVVLNLWGEPLSWHSFFGHSFRDYRDIFVTEPPKRSCQWQSIEEQGEYRQQTQRHDRPSGGFLEGWFSSRHNVTASPHAIHLKHILDFGEGQVNLGDDCRRSLQQGFGRQVYACWWTRVS